MAETRAFVATVVLLVVFGCTPPEEKYCERATALRIYPPERAQQSCLEHYRGLKPNERKCADECAKQADFHGCMFDCHIFQVPTHEFHPRERKPSPSSSAR